MRKSTLYGGRIAGDLDLGLEPTHVDGDGEKRWAEVFAPGGLLPGQTAQGIHEQSLTQKYRLGTRRVVDDRVFRYARAGSAEALRPAYGVMTNMTFPESAAAAEASAVDTYTVTCTSQAAVTEDYYKDGWLAVSYYAYYRIKSNTAQATPGGTFVVTLYEPLVMAIGTDTITLFKNTYAEVRCLRQYFIDHGEYPFTVNYGVFVGVPMAVEATEGMVTASYYSWIQTWGPCLVAGVDNYGAAAQEFRLQWQDDGSVVVQPAAVFRQLAGYLLPNTWFGDAGHDLPCAMMLVDLHISP